MASTSYQINRLKRSFMEDGEIKVMNVSLKNLRDPQIRNIPGLNIILGIKKSLKMMLIIKTS